MSSGRCRGSLGALLLLLGGNLAVIINVHQESVNGTRGQSALLPVSYGFDGAPRFPVTILWRFPNSSDTLINCTVLSCSLGAGGAPRNCSANFFPPSAYRGRAELFPENGSLLLRDLRLSDSGVYTVAFREPLQTRNVTLTVHEPRPPPQHPCEGRNLAVIINVHQESVNGTRGQSALLPVSYRFDGAPRFPVSILWMFPNSSDPLITCTVLSCSLGAGGAPHNCSANFFPRSTYGGRAELFPKNGSLLLRDLRLSDSGVYTVTFRDPLQTRTVTLTVHEPRPPPQHPREDTSQGAPIRPWVIGVCSSVSLLLLFLLFSCIWHRGAAQRKKRRIIKQQQVSNGEESHIESAMARDVATIYSRIGDTFVPPQPRPTLEAVYTTITSPGPPGLGAGPCHLPV